MVPLLIPLVIGLVTVAATLIGIIWIWRLAIGEAFKQGRRRKRPVPSIPGFYVPRWGSTAREHARWDEDFAVAEAKGPEAA